MRQFIGLRCNLSHTDRFSGRYWYCIQLDGSSEYCWYSSPVPCQVITRQSWDETDFLTGPLHGPLTESAYNALKESVCGSTPIFHTASLRSA